LAYARHRGDSRTPESVESSDNEDAHDQTEGRQNDSNKKRNTANVPTHSPRSKTSSRKATSNKDASKQSQGKVPAKSSLVAKTSVDDATEEDELISDSEADEHLAPLPTKLPKTRSQRKRGASVASEDDSAAEEFRPRRGRSASVAPHDPESARAPASKAEPARSGKRQYAAKSTGRKPPRKK